MDSSKRKRAEEKGSGRGKKRDESRLQRIEQNRDNYIF